jgi:hypothetical protein
VSCSSWDLGSIKYMFSYVYETCCGLYFEYRFSMLSKLYIFNCNTSTAKQIFSLSSEVAYEYNTYYWECSRNLYIIYGMIWTNFFIFRSSYHLNNLIFFIQNGQNTAM